MTDGQILDLAREAVFTAALMSAPLLLGALISGVAVGLLQALTSVQEMTLTFVPKVAVMLLVFSISSAYMMNMALKLFNDRILPLIG